MASPDSADSPPDVDLPPSGDAARKVVLAVVSNKGGVGKTFVSTNLAVYLRALYEDLPVTLLGLDDQIGIDRLLSGGPPDPDAPNLKHAFAERNLDRALRLGEFGIHYVPSPPDVGALKTRARDVRILRRMIDASTQPGLFILDCKSDLEALTRSAVTAADFVILPVADQASLDEAGKVFDWLERDGGAPGRGRVLLTLVDRRTRVGADGRDLYDRLVDEVDARSWPRFATHLSRSPRVEALQSGTGRPRPVLLDGRSTAVHRQLRELAEEVAKRLDLGSTDASPPAMPAPRVESRPGGVKRGLLGGFWRER